MTEPCWCTGCDSWSNLGTASHAPGEACPIRAHWLDVEDSER